MSVKRHLFLPLSSEVTQAGQGSSRPQGEEVKGCHDISGLLLRQPLVALPRAAAFLGRENRLIPNARTIFL